MPDVDQGAGGAGHAGYGAGGGAAASNVDPFPYDAHGAQHAYDPYSGQPSMEMPDARNYAPGTGYGSYAGEGGYGVAAAMGGGAAAGAAGGYAANHYGNQGYSNTDYSQYSTSDQGHSQGQGHGQGQGYPTSPPMTAGEAKRREAAAERQGNRQSPQWGSNSNYNHQGAAAAGGSGSPEEDMTSRRQSQAMSDGRGSTVYQHTDYGEAPEDSGAVDQPAEIPPK